jgi:hypothetical protein
MVWPGLAAQEEEDRDDKRGPHVSEGRERRRKDVRHDSKRKTHSKKYAKVLTCQFIHAKGEAATYEGGWVGVVD